MTFNEFKGINILGLRSGKLLVIAFDHIEYRMRTGQRKRISFWRCKCDCGNETAIEGSRLRKGKARACGCERGKDRAGLSKSPAYSSWMAMTIRCQNPNYHSFKNYGGRGIKVCERWSEFENFLTDMGPRPKGTSLDRINNDGNYEPGNCRWATKKTQDNNRRTCKPVTFKGRTLPVSEWAKELGLNHITLRTRLSRGWSIDDALTIPTTDRWHGTWAKKNAASD
jgi:hypothetical protein